MIAERLEGEDGIAAVLFMDLDNFKVINDTLGHIKGICCFRRWRESLRKH